MLKYLITSKTKRKLLRLFLTNPDQPFYTRQIAKITAEPLNAVRRELGYLEKAGLIKSRSQGNLKLYEAVRDFPLFAELKKIIYATIGLGGHLRDTFKDPGSIELAFVYGSVARNTDMAGSDVDLFVVGDVDDTELHELVTKVETEIGREINYTLMSMSEFRKRHAGGDPFIKRIEKEEKLLLKGSEDVFRRID